MRPSAGPWGCRRPTVWASSPTACGAVTLFTKTFLEESLVVGDCVQGPLFHSALATPRGGAGDASITPLTARTRSQPLDHHIIYFFYNTSASYTLFYPVLDRSSFYSIYYHRFFYLPDHGFSLFCPPLQSLRPHIFFYNRKTSIYVIVLSPFYFIVFNHSFKCHCSVPVLFCRF